jgi:hypothetical protein
VNNEQVEELVQKYNESFDILCQERHDAGQKEYGVFTFLGNDVVRMMAEELADTSNYCRMQFIKLMMLNDLVAAELSERADDDGNITIGVKAFKGTGEVGWNK